jgi:hypothetical protein
MGIRDKPIAPARGGGGLLLQGFAQIIRALAQLVEQPTPRLLIRS